MPAWAYQSLNRARSRPDAFGEASEKILHRRRRSVAAPEIEVHSRAERFGADQRFEHANDFGALLIDRRRVEIVDFVIDRRAHGMRERPGVLGKLRRLQSAHVGDALDRRRALIGGEFLIAKDGQALLEAELKPIAAGDAIAGPIVKIFVSDDALDAGVIVVGRRLRRGQHIFVVEDVEALVLHCAHVEVGHGDDVEAVEIVFAAEGALVPRHRTLQRVHRIGGALLASAFDVDAERHLSPGHRDERIRDMGEIAGHQREEIARLLERIAPNRPMAALFGLADAFEIAVGEQHRRLRLVRLQAHAIGRENVRAVEKIRDAAKALGLALRAIGGAGTIETHQLGVAGRIEPRFDAQREGAAGRIEQDERGRARPRRRTARAARCRASRRRNSVRRRRAPARRRRALADWAASSTRRRRASRCDRAKYRDRRNR